MPFSDYNPQWFPQTAADGEGSQVQGDNMIVALIELTPLPGKREKILELLRFSVDRLTGRPGCLSSGVYEAGDEKHTILYLERWKSEEAFHRHIQSNLYRGVLNALDLAREPRGISFHAISETKSMELILALRTASVVSTVNLEDDEKV